MVLLALGLLFFILCSGLLIFVFKISSQVNERLSQMSQALQESNKIVSQNLGNTVNVFGNVKEQLGRLEVTNKQIIDISRDISSLQELLRAPKFRGAMGETMLENLLSQVLPRQHYSSQYRFKTSDTVDAVIRLADRLVSVDAKFSLENFQKMLEAQDEQSKVLSRKKFIQDVKNRIDEVASKYILPQENTYDFALMYIPAENVYYEVVIKEDLFSYGLSRKVIPVSPNTFYAYLQVICLGLKGFKVEENAKAILKSLSALDIELNKFKEEFDILGGHLSNAHTRYLDSQKRLERFSDRLSHMQDNRQIEG